MPRGGRREGAGRPRTGRVPVKVRLSERQRAIFQIIGGSKWLQQRINEEETKMTKFEKLSRGAKSIINNLFGDGPITRGAALDALTDGEYLESINATERVASEAYEFIEMLPVDRETELSLYEVLDAVRASDPFDYGDEALERRLLDCYDDHNLGLFSTDAAAAAAAEALQLADDAKAEEIGRGALGKDFALSGGPSYRDHIVKWTADDLEPVEL